MPKQNTVPANGLLRQGSHPTASPTAAPANQSVCRALSLLPHSKGRFALPQANRTLSRSDRVRLTRKANELFQLGQLSAAERIYLSVGYSSGLLQLAQHYSSQGNFVRAYLLFAAAADRQQAEALAKRFAAVLKKWLSGRR